MKDILVVVTMDCERPRSETRPSASGPPDIESSERWIRGYQAIAARYGFPVTYFAHPEIAVAHPGLFLEAEANGACLGLHLHPWKFAGSPRQEHFGGLSRDGQIEILNAASAIWAEAIGRRPLYFRPGTFSANDRTFEVLIELGFLGGSLSAPGRVYRELCAIWTGAPADPHRANPIFRQLEGGSDFVNMPLSVDQSNVVQTNGRVFHRDLRPDYAEADYDEIVGNILAQVVERDPVVPVINLVTHNDNDYTDPDDRVCRNFVATLEAIVAKCNKRGLQPKGSTMADVHAAVIAVPEAARELETVGVLHGWRSGSKG